MRRPARATRSPRGDLSSAYSAWADPITRNSTGVRYFWTNTLGTIYVFNTTLSRRERGTEAPGSGTVLQ